MEKDLKMRATGNGQRATKKRPGLILVFTGDGKGKTTAAIGTALRMVSHGGCVAMVQFFKRATHNAQRTTKVSALSVDRCALSHGKEAGELIMAHQLGSLFRVWSFGGGFTWQVAHEENAKAVRKAWRKCRELLPDPKYDLVIFDEIHIALRYKFLKATDVLKALKAKWPTQHVILTGRGAPKAILKIADLVTEMTCVKHPFDQGIPAPKGIDF